MKFFCPVAQSLFSNKTVWTHAIHWAFLVAQRVKNWLAMQETQVQSLGQEDPLEKGMATHYKSLSPGNFHE